LSIFGIGTVVVDHVVEFARYPEPDTKNPVDRHWQQIGGPVPVALSTSAFYGSRGTFLGRWGNDSAGEFIERGLTARGISICPACVSVDSERSKWKTGFAHVWTDTSSATRTIAYSRGEFPDLTDQDLDPAILGAHKILHLDGAASKAAIAAAKIMHNNSCFVVLDAGSYKPGMDELMPYVDLLVASSLFRSSRFNNPTAPIEFLHSLGCQAVITTNGDADVSYFDGTNRLNQPAFQVNAVDTNGAGDIFTGALLHAITNEWSMKRSLRFATTVAAWSCTQRGNSSYPTPAQIDILQTENQPKDD
jgi:sugar/nucleoside kinase (ribokinase family)